MKLEEMQAEWKIDSKINKNDLSGESLRTPQLHSKYIDMYIEAKSLLNQCVKDYEQERKIMTKYYKGELTQEELDEKGIGQWLYKKPLKSEMDEILKTDEFVVTKYNRVQHVELTIEFLQSVLGQIKQRDWTIKNSIQHTIFINGG